MQINVDIERDLFRKKCWTKNSNDGITFSLLQHHQLNSGDLHQFANSHKPKSKNAKQKEKSPGYKSNSLMGMHTLETEKKLLFEVA